MVRTKIWHMRRCIYLLIFSVAILSGCIFSSGRYYIGSYEMSSGYKHKAKTCVLALEIARRIAKDINYKLEMERCSSDLILVSLWPIDPLPEESRSVRLLVETYGITDGIGIEILQFNPEETAEIVRLRKCIEKVLAEYPDLKWKYVIDHSTMARY